MSASFLTGPPTNPVSDVDHSTVCFTRSDEMERKASGMFGMEEPMQKHTAKAAILCTLQTVFDPAGLRTLASKQPRAWSKATSSQMPASNACGGSLSTMRSQKSSKRAALGRRKYSACRTCSSSSSSSCSGYFPGGSLTSTVSPKRPMVFAHRWKPNSSSVSGCNTMVERRCVIPRRENWDRHCASHRPRTSTTQMDHGGTSLALSKFHIGLSPLGSCSRVTRDRA
mmetsp:Transcript_64882/g.200965  ORF Transcript_64882/g.200965 Transcript_64882/m.200965 type:complete len:226 (+) Transcript_64882:1094-1771(+)